MPEGVVEHGADGERVLTTEPMAIALDTGDGRVIIQRVAGYVDRTMEPAATVPLVVGDDGDLTELFGTADWDGDVTLHDVELVDGRRLLLFGLTVEPNDPNTSSETLYVVDLDTKKRTTVDRNIGGWEFGTGRLHLATTGLIVGESDAVSVPLDLHRRCAGQPPLPAPRSPRRPTSAWRSSTPTASIAPARTRWRRTGRPSPGSTVNGASCSANSTARRPRRSGACLPTCCPCSPETSTSEAHSW